MAACTHLAAEGEAAYALLLLLLLLVLGVWLRVGATLCQVAACTCWAVVAAAATLRALLLPVLAVLLLLLPGLHHGS
jgi:hypothetical protein